MCRLGRAMFPEEWHDDDTLTRKQESLQPDGAHGRLLAVMPWIADHARDGDFDTLIYDEQSMAITRQTSTIWVRPDVFTAYFQTCRLTPVYSSSTTDPAPYIFFDAPAFETAIARLTCPAQSGIGVEALSDTPAAGSTVHGLKSDRTGAPERPSSMHIFKNLMRQRSAAGTMLTILSAEARELLLEFSKDQSHIGLRIPTQKAIENSLRPLHRELKNKPQK